MKKLEQIPEEAEAEGLPEKILTKGYVYSIPPH